MTDLLSRADELEERVEKLLNHLENFGNGIEFNGLSFGDMKQTVADQSNLIQELTTKVREQEEVLGGFLESIDDVYACALYGQDLDWYIDELKKVTKPIQEETSC